MQGGLGFPAACQCGGAGELVQMPLRAVNAAIAIGISLLPFPALQLLDRFNGNCGDGLCGFWSGLLVLGGLAVATGIFLRRSAKRAETPAALRLVPLAAWLSLLFFL
jgi:hypothetical protein